MKGSLALFKSVKLFVYSTPSPSSISYQWNFGSILGICLITQIVSGLFLSFHYSASLHEAFDSVVKICEEVNGGWMARSVHANGASFFFIFIFLHIARGLFFESYISHSLTWVVGVSILFLLMVTAFLGYVLPWGQMSLWGATVITNLISAFPQGSLIVEWIWGGFSVSQPTLTRFYSFHFIFPMVIFFLVFIHIIFLHSSGSSNPLGVELDSDKSFFHPLFTVKDVFGLVVVVPVFLFVCLLNYDLFMDSENFIRANPLITPPHIQPEWYFLFAYSILRSTPNKLGGVVALLFSVLIIAFLPLSGKSSKFRFSLAKKMMTNFFFVSFLVLTWIGSMPVEWPFVQIGQIFSFGYFFSILTLFFI